MDDDDDVRIPGASVNQSPNPPHGHHRPSADATAATMKPTSEPASNGAAATSVAVKKEPTPDTTHHGSTNHHHHNNINNQGSSSLSATPSGSKDEDSPTPNSLSPDDVKMASSNDSVSTPETGHTPGPKLARKSSAAIQSSKAATPPRMLFGHLADATPEATSQFQVIAECLYGSKHMGSSDHDAFECDCAEEQVGGENQACGEDSDCINRATKMECVKTECNCGPDCQNQRFQRKQYAKVSVIKTEKKGYGLRADADLNPNDFIYEYIGEVINEPTFRRRMIQYDEEGIKHFYFMSLTRNEFVDATRKGNLGRFCNHSCRPNCYVDKWVVGKKLRMGIFASRHIRTGEELVFDYNVDRYGAEPQPCYCGESNCTGFIGGKTQTERATKLSQATIEALGIDDPDSWDTTVAKKATRRKRPNEDDEEYVSSLHQSDLSEEGVTKVMAALMQCKEKWIAVKLLSRIQAASNDERVLNRVVRMHGYQILRAILTTFDDDNNVILQVLDILYKFPRLTRNKILDSKIEGVVEALTTSEHEDVAAESKRLMEEWSKLEVAYRIPRKKIDPTAKNATPGPDRRGRDDGRDDTQDSSNNATRQRPPVSPLHGLNIPKGPRSNVPQRNASFYNNAQRQRRATQQQQQRGNGFGNNGKNKGLPPGWFPATDTSGNVYYYTKSGTTTWTEPTQPADLMEKQPSKAQQERNAVQDIIDNITREPPRQSTTHTPQTTHTPVTDNRSEKWRHYPIEKQMKIYENTLNPHIKSVIAQFRSRLPKDELKKFGKEIGKKLVASDFKNNRVDDPNTISAKQEKKVKVYVKDFFEKAARKFHEQEKRRKSEREARHAAHRHHQHHPKDAATGSGKTEDTEMADVAKGSQQQQKPSIQADSAQGDGLEDSAEQRPQNGDGLAAMDDMALTDDDDDDDDRVLSPASINGGGQRKRKRTDTLSQDEGESGQAQSGGDRTATNTASNTAGPSPSLTPSETPSMKRVKEDDDAGAVSGGMTPPPPPPPPPPPLPADEELTEEERQMREQEAELMRENEEAQRLDEEEAEQRRAAESAETHNKQGFHQNGVSAVTAEGNDVAKDDLSKSDAATKPPQKQEVAGH